MKHMLKNEWFWTATILLALACMFASRRHPAALKEDPTPQLFTTTKDCEIYKFRESGESHFFANCKGTVTTEINRDGKKTDYIITRRAK